MKNLIVILLLTLGFIQTNLAQAYSNIEIQEVSSVSLDGPAHHGLSISLNEIDDPNLYYYEVNIKEDTGNPYYPTYKVYSTQIRPYDVSAINIPYRNGVMALEVDKKYCVRVRGNYSNSYSDWVEKCDIELMIPEGSTTDLDEDGLDENEEYAIGTDPNNADSDADGTDDGDEVALNSDPNSYLFPNIMLRTDTVDFGEGDYMGSYSNQHGYVQIENAGDDAAYLETIEIVDGDVEGSADSFKVGSFPASLSHVAPQSTIRVPVSFLPTQLGNISAFLKVTTTNNPTEIGMVPLAGSGMSLPGCNVTPSSLNFGTVDQGSGEAQVKYVTINNSDNSDAALGFTMSASSDDFAPGLRAHVLPAGKSLRVPVLFQPNEVGSYNEVLEVKSVFCGSINVELKATVE
jgi:hypothetical protein